MQNLTEKSLAKHAWLSGDEATDTYRLAGGSFNMLPSTGTPDMLFSIKRWLRRLTTPTTPILRPRPRVRLGLEPLEERFMPSAYTVTTTIDRVGDITKGQVTLRDVLTAIHSGNASGNAPAPTSANTISFAIGRSGSTQTINLTSALPTIPDRQPSTASRRAAAVTTALR